MTARQIEKATRGGSDIVRADPKPRRKYKHKTERQKAVDAADDAFSLYIRTLYPFCVTCGEPTQDCSHVFKRDHYSTRWNEQNAFGQCKKCHYLHHNKSESYLLEYASYHMGMKAFIELRDLWETISDYKTYQIEEIARFYNEKRKVLLANLDGGDRI